MSTEQRREEFERFAMSLDMDLLIDSDGYSDCNTDYAWQGWQAAINQPAAPAPKDADHALCEISLFGQLQEALEKIAILEQERDNLRDDLVFVERWANHHGQKAHMTPQETLSCIQHYPSILAITRSYTDGKVPETRNPYAEIAALEAQLAAQPKTQMPENAADALFLDWYDEDEPGLVLIRRVEDWHGIIAAAQGEVKS